MSIQRLFTQWINTFFTAKKMMMNTTKSFLTLLALLFLAFACQPQEKEASGAETLGATNAEESPAKQLINEVIDAHGGDRYENIRVEFDFRNRHYITDRNNGVYQNERIFKDENGATVRDVMTNDSFVRYMNGEKTTLTEKNEASYRNSINSVIYFTLLPYFLNDPAVKMEMLDPTTLGGVTYQKVKVTFQQEYFQCFFSGKVEKIGSLNKMYFITFQCF